MKVTPIILEKYYIGAANIEEQQAVELWLQHAELDTPISVSSPSDELRKEMWSKIISSGAYRNYNRYTRLIAYSVAASITVAIIGVTLLYNVQKNIPQSKTHFAQVTIRPASYNKRDYKIGNKGELFFCGDMEIGNKGNTDYRLLFKTTCSTNRPIQKSFLIKKGQTYIAVMFTYKTEEILVINKEELRRETQPLPQRLTQKLTNEFKI